MKSVWNRHYEARFILCERRGYDDPWNDAGLVASGIIGVVMLSIPVIFAVAIIASLVEQGEPYTGSYLSEGGQGAGEIYIEERRQE